MHIFVLALFFAALNKPRMERRTDSVILLDIVLIWIEKLENSSSTYINNTNSGFSVGPVFFKSAASAGY